MICSEKHSHWFLLMKQCWLWRFSLSVYYELKELLRLICLFLLISHRLNKHSSAIYGTVPILSHFSYKTWKIRSQLAGHSYIYHTTIPSRSIVRMPRALASPLLFPNNPLSWVNPLAQANMPCGLLGEQAGENMGVEITSNPSTQSNMCLAL